MLFLGASSDDDYTSLDLEHLNALSAAVTTVSRRAQRLIDAPAAISVISSEDIRRSGLTSIPELLRLVPGLQVSRSGSDSWAITARGFASEFSNKLLVLIDGRGVYTPTFSGVYWNLQDTLLDDIDRIEVIRGPGASVWGANAVNGVINIITKSAGDTQGDYASALVGSEDRAIVSMRMGRSLGENFHYRVYGKIFGRDQATDFDGHATPDDWRMERLGYRLSGGAGRDHFEVDSNIFRGRTGTSVRDFAPDAFTTGTVLPSDETERLGGGHGLFRWRRDYAERDAQELQVYYDQTQLLGGQYSEIRHTGHAEYQREFVPFARNSVIAGLGWRVTARRLTPSLVFDTTRPKTHGALYSGFAQDEIELLAERVWLTLGSKIEWNNRSGFELEPSARLLWTPRSNQQIWTSFSRSTRAPSEAEQDITSRLAIIPAGVLAPEAQTVGLLASPDLESEVLLASELGYRIQPAPNVSIDLALFYNQYQNLRAGRALPPFNVTLVLENSARAVATGGELELQWQVRSHWRLRASYSNYNLAFHDAPTASLEAKTAPRHQWRIGSSLDLPGNLELDATLAFVDDVATLSGVEIGSYLRGDVRIGWKPRNGLELSLGCQNLNDERHPEWAFLFGGDTQREIERNVYGAVTWRF